MTLPLVLQKRFKVMGLEPSKKVEVPYTRDRTFFTLTFLRPTKAERLALERLARDEDDGCIFSTPQQRANQEVFVDVLCPGAFDS